MDFLKQNNFRYIVIIIIIILAVINLYKINSQENFMILTEEQDLGTHNVKINSTDQVIFGNKTLTDKLTNIESGVLTLGTDNNGSTSIVDGKNGLHLQSNKDVLLMSPSENATVVSKQQGNSGKLVVEGEATFKTDLKIESGVLTLGTDNNGSTSIVDGKNDLHLKSNKDVLLMSPSENATVVSKQQGNSGKLVVEGEAMFKNGATIKNGLATETSGEVGFSINCTNTDKTENNQAYNWSIMNFNNYGSFGSGLAFWRYSKLGCKGGGMCNQHMILKDDGSTRFEGDLYSFGFINLSDRRLKENIKNISQNDKDKVLQLVPKTYNMISDQNKKRYGLIAQEVEELYPELVDTNKTDDMKSINYIELIPLLLEQIKELKKTIPNQNVINIGGVTLNSNELLKLKNMINNNTI